MSTKPVSALYGRIREILESARAGVARSVNTTQVVANWLIGREIVEEEQKGEAKAEYGAKLLAELSTRLKKEYGNGYSVDNLELFRRFYQGYSALISEAVPRKCGLLQDGRAKGSAERSRFESVAAMVIPHAVSAKSWKPGLLHPSLSWTHYRMLLKADELGKRTFYEIEAIKNNWSARELDRQICSLLYERLVLSRDKKGVMRLAVKGHAVHKPADVFKDPMVMEFLGLPESSKLVETDLEQAMINNLQSFLLELGKGFAFIARQERLTLDGDHFYIDLVFYHTVLKCFVIIDLKTSKLTQRPRPTAVVRELL